MTSSPESFSTRGTDGVRIVADRLGDPAAPAVVFLHGGGQTRRSWARAAAAVAKRGWQAVAVYNPHRPRPSDLDGLRTNLRQRDGRWYWHWDPKFIDGTSALPPIEVTEAARMHTAVEAILRDDVPMLLVRGQMSDLVTKERADDFLARFPEVSFVDVGGAGHMVAGDRNDLFADAIVEFLTRHEERG